MVPNRKSQQFSRPLVMGLRAWLFGTYFEPPAWLDWVQVWISTVVFVWQQILISVGKAWWKGSRMWNGDAKKEAEKQSHEACSCAKDRDEWREKARRHDLIPGKRNEWQAMLWVRKVHHEVSKSMRSLAISPQHDPPFLKLPFELREQIYKYHISEWSSERLESPGRSDLGMPISPYEPPLTRVCKLMRTETLDVFYRTARFPVIFHFKNESAVPGPLYTAVDWYEHLDPNKLCLIRHLELYLCLRNRTYGRDRNPFIFNVDLGSNGWRAYWAYAHSLWLQFSVIDGEPLVAICEEENMSKMSARFRSVARDLGSAGLVSAPDVYRFIE